MPDSSLIHRNNYLTLKSELDAAGVTLVAVSKTQSADAILEIYQLGQRIFGENRAQELLEKANQLPQDIAWHLIGHLQTNKVRQILPCVSMISSVDSIRLLNILQKEASAAMRNVDILLQLKISPEATKYGFDVSSIVNELMTANVKLMTSLRFRGVMGMASFVDDPAQIRQEFRQLKTLFDTLKATVFRDVAQFDQICMGMSGDYHLAIEEGSTMVRIGSLIFGERK